LAIENKLVPRLNLRLNVFHRDKFIGRIDRGVEAN
jgi:hypothetical protein